MSATRFDPAEPIAKGRTVIEASAGTGKTFTIAALVTRLVAVEGLDVEHILVVTFTRAATAELRDRVRRRMVDTLAALEGTPPGVLDDHVKVLLEAPAGDRERYATRLADALTRFDRAQISTIDGFGQRLLRQLGFAARLSPDLEPGEVDDMLVAQVAGDLMVGRFADDAATAIDVKALRKLGTAVVATPDARIVPELSEVDGAHRVRVEMAHDMRSEVTRRLRVSGRATFDDPLLEVRDALQDAAVRDAARELLRRRYVVGLVDESQDTDPIQWQVIRAVFDPTRLVVIGDPKQSIYSFRGADVESYLSAVAGASAHRTLDENWRSDGPLVTALDVLFHGAKFGDDRIAYRTVEPARGHEESRIRGVAPVSIRVFDEALAIPTHKWGYVVAKARRVVAADTAAEVVRLLNGKANIVDAEGARPVGPRDIAVLCRTRSQVDMVRTQLTRRGVPSVAARTGGVFVAEAAEQWRRFLLAVERPDRADMARMAATTVFVGKAPHEVAAMIDEEVLDLQARMREWQACLHQDGVPALIAAINRRTDLAARVLAERDGERTMTDLLHIAEELHAVWRRGRVTSLVAWLETAMAEAQDREFRNREEPESRQRRLETDAAAVQVQTVHGAKGLQYPVVLVPFAWDTWRPRADNPVFHDPEAPIGDQPRPRLIDVAGKGWAGHAAHADLDAAEEEAEEGRQLYVALTRAQHHLVVWWLPLASGATDSKLGELITRLGPDPVTLVAASGGKIEVPTVSERPPLDAYRPAASEGVALDRARFTRRLDYEWRRASFTSLSPEHPLVAAAEVSEQAVRSDEIAVEQDEPVPAAAAVALPMADLPRGARFGTLVHEILEHIRFDDPELQVSLRAEVDESVHRSGWDFDPEALVAALEAAIDTPLGPDADAVRLRDLPPDRLLKEMTFELPVRTGARAVSLQAMAGVMLDHLPAGDPYRRYADDLRALPPTRFHGYLTGAIDLTAAVDGRFIVMDFKTNAMRALGDPAASADYGPAPLTEAMIDGNYVLQATLYQVALHRYLQWRLPRYDPAVHLGGARYLFVRGMSGSQTPVVDGERCGVARWAPPAAMIVALSELFATDGGATS